jgi:hypothetical protein
MCLWSQGSRRNSGPRGWWLLKAFGVEITSSYTQRHITSIWCVGSGILKAVLVLQRRSMYSESLSFEYSLFCFALEYIDESEVLEAVDYRLASAFSFLCTVCLFNLERDSSRKELLLQNKVFQYWSLGAGSRSKRNPELGWNKAQAKQTNRHVR